MPKVRKSLSVMPHVWSGLEEAAKKRGMTTSALIQHIIYEFLAKEIKK